MDNRPVGRVKKVISGSGKIQKQGTGLGGGPVGNRKGDTGLNADAVKKSLNINKKTSDKSGF